MSRESFKPLGFANYLVDTGDYRKADKQFLHWGGTHWEEIDEHDMQSLALDWIEEFGGHGNANCNNAKQACATAMLRLSKLTEPSKETIVPVLNGYVHLDATGVKLLPHDKELGLRHVIKCNFDPTAPTSVVFERFLERILPDAAVRQRVQEYIGYTLQPDARHQIAQFWLGSGANGKGVLANIVQALHHRVAAVNLDQLNNFNMTETVNASLIYCDEAPQERISDRTFKMVTAGEKMTINRKYRDPISTRILGKWLILGNHVPTITDHSEGFWRRLDIVPFDVTIPVAERDPLLANHIIEHELSGVLNWALEGAVRLLARGGFESVKPIAMTKVVEVAKLESNTVLNWWQDTEQSLKTTVDTLKQDVYGAYTGWCKAHGLSSVPMPKFWKRLTAVVSGVLESRMSTRGGRPRVCNIALHTRY